jgi:5-methylcytosine-specific restriction endonuclease McrA
MFPALVLTPCMSPHQVVPWYEAVCLVYKKKAYVLEAYDETVSGPPNPVTGARFTMALPSVLQLSKPLALDKKDVKYSRANVYQRDKHTCQYCGKRKRVKDLNLDHVVPRSRGGPTNFSNIVTSCKRCNEAKDSRTPEEAGMRLLRQPRPPRSLRLVRPLIPLPATVPDAWLPFLGGAREELTG